MVRFYSKKEPRRTKETLIDQISTGKCDDQVVSELKTIITELPDQDRDDVLVTMKDIALQSGSAASVAGAVKILLAYPMEPGLDDTLEIRALDLINDRTAYSSRPLEEAIAELLYLRISGRVDRAEPFVEALIQFLDERSGTGGTTAYNSLMIVAANRPEYFQQYAGSLVKMLGSINRATRIQTARLISVLAMSHPEYVASAEQALLSLSSFTDGELKNSASEALQILSSKLHPDAPSPLRDSESRRQEPETTGSLAEIMRRKAGGKDKKVTYESRIDKRLLSLATNFARKAPRAYSTDGEEVEPESETDAINQIMDDFSDIAESIKAEATPDVPAEPADESPEEAELRRMMEKVKDDFSINAGNILDAIGMGHLAKKPEEMRSRAEVPARDRPKRGHPMYERAPARKPVEEEKDVSPKELIESIESIISRTEKDQSVPDTTPSQPAPEPATPIVADGSGDVAPEETVTAEAHAPETAEPEPLASVEEALPALPEVKTHDAPATRNTPPGPLKMPSAGVRITAMKLKSVDQSKSRKTPTPPKISIKPHVKPLNKTPIDATKSAPVRQHPMASAPLAPRTNTQKADAPQGQIVCHSCNARMPEDSQRCAICGADLKSPKVRCRKCGEINARGAGKCSRCGSLMDE